MYKKNLPRRDYVKVSHTHTQHMLRFLNSTFRYASTSRVGLRGLHSSCPRYLDGTMKAAVCTKLGSPLEVKEVPIPKVGLNDCLVKMEACGVCHTDLHAIEGDWPVQATPPFIPGHEGVGRVVEVGSNVNSVKVGERVGIPWLFSACGHCEHCLGGWETLCHDQLNGGFTANGAFSEYAIADPNYVAHVPEEVDAYDCAPVLCAGLTVYKGLKMSQCRSGQTVVIGGVGGLGQLAVQYAVAMGFDVVAVDINDVKLDQAKQMGAMYTVNAKTEDPAAFIQSIGGAHGALLTAVSPSAFEQAMHYLRRGGVMVMNGLPPGKFPISIFDTVLNGITIRGSIVGTRLDMVEALRFFAENKVKPDVVKDKLENINQIFDDLKQGKVKSRVVIDFSA